MSCGAILTFHRNFVNFVEAEGISICERGIQCSKLVRLPVTPQYFTLSVSAAVSSNHDLLRGSPVRMGAGSIGKGFATLEPKNFRIF
tara:strand:- start:695 stop:955 length:261 start_codon:yes stop_codon:yes gene_type:complete